MSNARSRVSPATLSAPATILAVLGWLGTAAALAWLDPVYAAATVALGVVLWIADAPAAALAVTQVGMAAVTTDPAPATIALLEAGPILLVVALLSEDGLSARTLAVAAAIGTLLTGVTVVGLVSTGSIALTAVALVVVAGAISYVLFEYEAVVRELAVEEATAGENA